jgi:hypothetical protein
MIKAAFSLASIILVAGFTSTSADSYPDSFADYLNARGLYFSYLSRAESSFWVKNAAGDVVLKMPRAITPKISIVAAEGYPADAEIADIQGDLESALSSALDRLGIRRCSIDATSDPSACTPIALQIGFSAKHGDVIYMPLLRDLSGHIISGQATEYFERHDRPYMMGCISRTATTAEGDVAQLDAAFILENSSSTADMPSLFDFAGSGFLPARGKPLIDGMENCLLGLLGVDLPEGLPREDIDYYVARSLEAMHKAEIYLTHDQIVDDIPALAMTHALRKALGKEPTVGQ